MWLPPREFYKRSSCFKNEVQILRENEPNGPV